VEKWSYSSKHAHHFAQPVVAVDSRGRLEIEGRRCTGRSHCTDRVLAPSSSKTPWPTLSGRAWKGSLGSESRSPPLLRIQVAAGWFEWELVWIEGAPHRLPLNRGSPAPLAPGSMEEGRSPASWRWVERRNTAAAVRALGRIRDVHTNATYSWGWWWRLGKEEEGDEARRPHPGGLGRSLRRSSSPLVPGEVGGGAGQRRRRPLRFASSRTGSTWRNGRGGSPPAKSGQGGSRRRHGAGREGAATGAKERAAPPLPCSTSSASTSSFPGLLPRRTHHHGAGREEAAARCSQKRGREVPVAGERSLSQGRERLDCA
jgi:hypothetical protein